MRNGGIYFTLAIVAIVFLFKVRDYLTVDYLSTNFLPIILPTHNIKVVMTPNKPKIVISLTTSPARIKKINPVIECMMNQTIQPERIYLNLPKVFKRNGSTFQMPLPKFITDNPLIYVNFCDDIGPATKILPTLDLIKDPETLILSIDDDIYYPEHLIETFFAFSNDYPNSCITGSSYMFKKESNTSQNTLLKGREVELLEGYSGVLYKRKFFNDTLINQITTWINENKGCKFGDDFSLSNALIKNGTNIIMIGKNFDAIWKIKPLDYGLGSDALHWGASGSLNGANYQVCSDYLKNKSQLAINYHR